MKTSGIKSKTLLWLLLAALCCAAGLEKLHADGTETLGAPAGLTVTNGSGIALGGVGLDRTNAGALSVMVPGDAVVNQVLLYWQGVSEGPDGDDSVMLNGTVPVTGTLIGGSTQIFPGVYESAYRADITALGLVAAGTNELALSELEFSRYNNGAGVIVIYSNAAPGIIRLVDGDDFALEGYLSPLDTTVAQTFLFRPSPLPRQASLNLLVGGSEGLNAVLLKVGRREARILNPLTSANGMAWDSLQTEVTIPPGVTNLSVQILSGDGSLQPGQASLISWVAAALAVPPPPMPSNRPPQIVLHQLERSFCSSSNGRPITVHGLVRDADRDTLTVDWFVNGALVETQKVELIGTNSAPIQLTYTFLPGTNAVRAEVSDGTNAPVSARTLVRVVLDDVPPELSCKTPKPRKANPHGVARIPGVAYKTKDNCTPTCELVKTQDPRPGTAVGPGLHDIVIRVVDRAGNAAECTTTLEVTPHKKPKKSKKSKKTKKSKKKSPGKH